MALCPFAPHTAHLEISAEELRQALSQVAWPLTADLIPPADPQGDYDWPGFYQERIHLGILSLYPRTLTGPLAFTIPSLTPPQPLLELLMVPHWSHLTSLRQGVGSRQQRLQAILYGCCELAFVQAVMAELRPGPPPLLYGITHDGPGDLFRYIGYQWTELPPHLEAIYRPAITRLLQRDDPDRPPVQRLLFIYLPGDAASLEQTRRQILAVIQRVTGVAAAFGGSF